MDKRKRHKGRKQGGRGHWTVYYTSPQSFIITQPNRYKRAERNLLADEKGPHY